MTETDDKILMQLGTAHHALAAARSIGDFKKIADVAAAAEMYARRVKLSQESVDFALEIRLRAERGLGEVLARTPKHKGRLKRGSAVPEGNHGEPSTLAELGITKQFSSQAQKLAAVPSKTFEAKIASGERRPSAFIRTKVTSIKDPLGAFVQALLPLRKNPVAYYVDLASGIQEEPDALDLYNKCFDAIDRISAALDALEEWFPSLKGTRELERQAGSEVLIGTAKASGQKRPCDPSTRLNKLRSFQLNHIEIREEIQRRQAELRTPEHPNELPALRRSREDRASRTPQPKATQPAGMKARMQKPATKPAQKPVPKKNRGSSS
jgi:hypothetical protein